MTSPGCQPLPEGEKCERCRGRGQVRRPVAGDDGELAEGICPDCKGTGKKPLPEAVGPRDERRVATAYLGVSLNYRVAIVTDLGFEKGGDEPPEQFAQRAFRTLRERGDLDRLATYLDARLPAEPLPEAPRCGGKPGKPRLVEIPGVDEPYPLQATCGGCPDCKPEAEGNRCCPACFKLTDKPVCPECGADTRPADLVRKPEAGSVDGREACRCGHTAHWHAESGTGDCEFSGDCKCEAFTR
jgi:hypothetical protein